MVDPLRIETNTGPGWPLRAPRVALLLLPGLLALRSLAPTQGLTDVPAQVLGGTALVLVPGYALLWSLGLDPLEPGAPGYRWPLVIPLSLAFDVILGVFLVLTPIGLSGSSLWVAMSVAVLTMGALSKVVRRQ